MENAWTSYKIWGSPMTKRTPPSSPWTAATRPWVWHFRWSGAVVEKVAVRVIPTLEMQILMILDVSKV